MEPAPPELDHTVKLELVGASHDTVEEGKMVVYNIKLEPGATDDMLLLENIL